VAGKKNKLKNNTRHCFLCGLYLDRYENKHLHRINPDKKYLQSNTVVLCTECKSYILKNNLDITDFSIPIYCIKRYFENSSINNKKIIMEKFYTMKAFKLNNKK